MEEGDKDFKYAVGIQSLMVIIALAICVFS